MEDAKLFNAEEVACNFYDWLMYLGYMNEMDKKEDIEDMIADFYVMQEKAPKLFNLIRNLSDCE